MSYTTALLDRKATWEMETAPVYDTHDLLGNGRSVYVWRSDQSNNICVFFTLDAKVHHREVILGRLLLLNKTSHFIVIIYILYTNNSSRSQAFITCPLGVHMVGYVMMCFGGCNAIGSFFIGQIQRCVHRIVIFSLGK